MEAKGQKEETFFGYVLELHCSDLGALQPLRWRCGSTSSSHRTKLQMFIIVSFLWEQGCVFAFWISSKKQTCAEAFLVQDKHIRSTSRLLKDMGLSTSDLIGACSDHESAIRAGLRGLECALIGCGAHAIQLAIKHAVPPLRPPRKAAKRQQRGTSSSSSSDTSSSSSGSAMVFKTWFSFVF